VVIGVLAGNQVLVPIVALVLVDVMHFCLGRERMAKYSLHNHDVFRRPSPAVSPSMPGRLHTCISVHNSARWELNPQP
jgi:hypothetical protein